jgi:hypothetical protein
MAQIRLWTVIGPANSGKTSTIGALVSQSKGAGGARDILLRGGGWIRIFAYRQSVQEAGKTPEDEAKRINLIVSKIKRVRPSYVNFLLALRSDSFQGLPQGDAYLNHFVTLGWRIESIVLLGKDMEHPSFNHYADFGAPIAEMLKSGDWLKNDLERNWVFGQARNHFGWA